MHCLDIDENDDELWFCLEGLDEDGSRNNEYYHDDHGQFRLKFFMVCDSYAKPPKTLGKRKPDND
jgi:hypothetical protein